MHQFIVEEKDVNNLVSKTYICTKKYCKIDIIEQRNTVSVNNTGKNNRFPFLDTKIPNLEE